MQHSRLPFELREKILAYAVKNDRRVEINVPAWTGERRAYLVPVTQVQRYTLEVGYPMFKQALMLILSNVYMQRPSHLSSSGMRYQTWTRYTDEKGPEGLLISPLPWFYPKLFLDIRRLCLTIHTWKAAQEEGWVAQMIAHLKALVNIMDYGCRLREFKLVLPLGQSPIPILDVDMSIWEPLKAMKISGSIRVDVLGSRGLQKDGISLKEYLTKIMSIEYVEDEKDESRI